MQSHSSSQPAGKLNIVAAVIIANGLIVAAIIIAKPNFSLGLPPISRGSVEGQFTQQMESHAEGKLFTVNHSKTTLKDFKVKGVKYLLDSKSYFVEYSFEWDNGYFAATGCFLNDNRNGKFSGQCATGEDQVKILVE